MRRRVRETSLWRSTRSDRCHSPFAAPPACCASRKSGQSCRSGPLATSRHTRRAIRQSRHRRDNSRDPPCRVPSPPRRRARSRHSESALDMGRRRRQRIVGRHRRRSRLRRRRHRRTRRVEFERRQEALDLQDHEADGCVFVGCSDGRVYGLDLASGKKVWEYEAASPVTSSPAVAKGKVVVATADGQIICFGSRQTPTVDSLSPKRGNFPLP